MANPRWRTVLFDLDGTLVDTIPLIVASYQHALTTVLGQPGDEARIKTWIGRTLVAAFSEVSPDRAEDLRTAYIEWNLAHTEELLRKIDGIDGLLDDLRSAGVGVGVVTSKRRATADLALRLAGLEHRVPLVTAMDDTQRHKPNPEPLFHGLGVLGGDPSSAAYVGDAIVDLQAARAASMGAVAVTWGAGTPDELRTTRPDAMTDTVAGLRQVLLVE